MSEKNYIPFPYAGDDECSINVAKLLRDTLKSISLCAFHVSSAMYIYNFLILLFQNLLYVVCGL